ncbi:MAG: hypothetical protein MUF06_21180 [Pirellulaceae bacterium]|nr:hypothetical protein [Pirellulaceae bacterium]
MRLTLRTMLAYLDNVLEPNESEELGRKIHGTEFASDLAKRIGVVTKKVRMNAPKLDGKGMGNDANTVSDYLDSSLPQDRVGDFERICLESDAHLAEVASCHQILTLVLGKPADVPESLRQRVYALGAVKAGTTADSAPRGPTPRPPAAAVVAAPSDQNGAHVSRPATEVPDYLRVGRRSAWLRPLAVVAALLLLGLTVVALTGPLNRSHPALAWLSGSENIAPDPVGASPQGSTTAENADSRAEEPAESGDRAAASEVPEGGGPTAPDTAPVQPETAIGANSNSSDRDVAPVLPIEPPAPTGDQVDSPMPPETPTVPEAPNAALADDPSASKPLPVVPAPSAAPPMPRAPIEVGRFLSDDQVLAHWSEGDRSWLRVPSRSVLLSGQQLVTLPVFRPQIALASGVQVTFVGESAAALPEPAADGPSRLAIEYGRIMAVTVGAAGAQVELDLAGVRGLLTLVDADSAVAISVKQFLPPGANPEDGPPIPVVEIFNTFGRVTWDEAEGSRVEIPVGHVRIYAGSDPPDTYGPFAPPEWIDARSLREIERQAAATLDRVLVEDKPLSLSLVETLEQPRIEIRSLAARCLVPLGEFEPILKELNDPQQYSYWVYGFASLRDAMQRGAHLEIKEVLERTRPIEAGDLYRLLQGYSPEQLAKEDAANLVRHLESEQMDIRVLAFQNLYAITGAMEFYRPEKRPEGSRSSIQNWKNRLAKGTIVYKSLPSAIEAYRPLERPPAGAAGLSEPRGAVGPIPPPPPPGPSALDP